MKQAESGLSWDYTALADSYHKRAPYAPGLISQVLELTGLQSDPVVCDVGAGTGFLSRLFAARQIRVLAVEPNAAMRLAGQQQCAHLQQIEWLDGRAEDTGLPADCVDLVSFGSSFNVVDQARSLAEASRICRPQGWFLAAWNHRDLSQGLQRDIEACIAARIPEYNYGKRRQDQLPGLRASGYFSAVKPITLAFEHQQSKADVIEAWYSHATLKRQAGSLHEAVLDEISDLIRQQPEPLISTRFVTRAWLARFS